MILQSLKNQRVTHEDEERILLFKMVLVQAVFTLDLFFI